LSRISWDFFLCHCINFLKKIFKCDGEGYPGVDKVEDALALAPKTSARENLRRE